MSTRTPNRSPQDRPVPGRARADRSSATRPQRRRVLVVIVVLVALAALYGIYQAASNRTTPDGTTAATAYDVGSPGPGEQAPGFTLPAADAGQVDLAAYQGQTVLLYFQEGLMCQPCWEQLKDLEKAPGAVEAAGVDAILSITNDPADLLRQKVIDEGITTPVVSDTDLAVSRQYATNQFGMMGDSRNGHSFVLVGPTGEIQWRADYGGAPDYTMYVPVEQLLADLRAGREGA